MQREQDAARKRDEAERQRVEKEKSAREALQKQEEARLANEKSAYVKFLTYHHLF